jgi:murein DD-endopeptidase MepM/ murein hydrolase activator NlpD
VRVGPAPLARRQRLVCALVIGSGLLVLEHPALARAAPVEQSQQAAAVERVFGLPFASPPGPSTWLLGQPYGNTTGAYRQRRTTYHAGQGIHFGVDFTARCGVEVAAAADGVVFAADAMSFGAAPHNLMIDHPDLGYATFYGHLMERPALASGQRVTKGQVVGKVGDPGETCRSRPHLHFEIRDLRHARKYNPVLLVEADWDTLALLGPSARTFQRDLSDPRRWQHLDDQPEIVVGGPLINDFAETWPPDSR